MVCINYENAPPYIICGKKKSLFVKINNCAKACMVKMKKLIRTEYFQNNVLITVVFFFAYIMSFWVKTAEERSILWKNCHLNKGLIHWKEPGKIVNILIIISIIYAWKLFLLNLCEVFKSQNCSCDCEW